MSNESAPNPESIPLTAEDRTRIRAKAEAVPRGKWYYVHGYGFSFHTSMDGPPSEATDYVCEMGPATTLRLLDERDALAKELEHLRKASSNP